MRSILSGKRLFFILAIVALLAGGGWYYYDRYLSAQASPPAETIETTQVYRGDLSQEEWEAMRATAEAGGMNLGNRGFRGGAGQLNILAQPLIELLTQRAAE